MAAPLLSALGIRDGDRAVLEALVERRGAAVLAYAERACAPGTEGDAVAEAFSRFRETIMTVEDPAALDPEATLLSATRRAAATRIPRPVAAPGGPLGRLLGGKTGPDIAAIVPGLLVARADGTLDLAGREQLGTLLASSAAARAVEERLLAAEEAYRIAPPRLTDGDLIDDLVDAMAGAGVMAAAEPAPVDEIEPEPELSDEPPAFDEPLLAEEEPVVYDEPVAEDEVVAEDVDPEGLEPEDEPLSDAAPAQVEPDVAVEEPAEEEPAAEEAEAETGWTVEDLEPFLDEPAAEAEAGDELAGEPAGGQPEWTVPPSELGAENDIALEIAAARLEPDEDDEHVQAASGAVDEAFLLEAEEQEPVEMHATVGPAEHDVEPEHEHDVEPEVEVEVPSPAPTPAFTAHAAGHRKSLAARLAPAAVVALIATIGAMAAAGVFGGNESSPPIDTGLAARRPAIEIPDGQAGAIVDELRAAAQRARRSRLADERRTRRTP